MSAVATKEGNVPPPVLPVTGLVDASGRLIAADPALESLQVEAGARVGARLAVPQLAEIARYARKLGRKISREARAGDAQGTLDLFVTAEPQDELVCIKIEEWRREGEAATTQTVADNLDRTLESPLSRIISAAEGISHQEDGPLQEKYADYAGDIAAAGRHLMSVLKSMSAQVGGADNEPVSMGEVVREAVQMVEPAADDRGVNFVIQGEANSSMMALGERRAILQILVNILGNAVRHSPRGGNVAIDFKAGAGSIEVRITDQGPGISEEDRERIFEPYERAHEADDGGKGLGLAISRRLARSMAGDLLLGDQPDQGARFTLRLPAAYRSYTGT